MTTNTYLALVEHGTIKRTTAGIVITAIFLRAVHTLAQNRIKVGLVMVKSRTGEIAACRIDRTALIRSANRGITSLSQLGQIQVIEIGAGEVGLACLPTFRVLRTAFGGSAQQGLAGNRRLLIQRRKPLRTVTASTKRVGNAAIVDNTLGRQAYFRPRITDEVIRRNVRSCGGGRAGKSRRTRGIRNATVTVLTARRATNNGGHKGLERRIGWANKGGRARIILHAAIVKSTYFFDARRLAGQRFSHGGLQRTFEVLAGWVDNATVIQSAHSSLASQLILAHHFGTDVGVVFIRTRVSFLANRVDLTTIVLRAEIVFALDGIFVLHIMIFIGTRKTSANRVQNAAVVVHASRALTRGGSHVGPAFREGRALVTSSARGIVQATVNSRANPLQTRQRREARLGVPERRADIGSTTHIRRVTALDFRALGRSTNNFRRVDFRNLGTKGTSKICACTRCLAAFRVQTDLPDTVLGKSRLEKKTQGLALGLSGSARGLCLAAIGFRTSGRFAGDGLDV